MALPVFDLQAVKIEFIDKLGQVKLLAGREYLKRLQEVARPVRFAMISKLPCYLHKLCGRVEKRGFEQAIPHDVNPSYALNLTFHQ